MDPVLASPEMTVEWSQDVAAAGFWALQVGDVALSYIEGRQEDGTEFRSLTFQGLSIDASGSGQHVWRIVRRAFLSELWRDGTRIATAGSGSGATGFVTLSFFGVRGPVTPFRGCTSYVSYAAGAFTPAELPSPTQGAGPSLDITLNTDASPEGSALLTVTAFDASGSPQSGVDVTLTAEAVARSGGHDHEVGRPTGTFSGSGITNSSPAHGTTGLDGKLTATYAASSFGGQEMLKAHVTDTPSISSSAVLEVRERDPEGRVFVPLPASPAIYVKDGGTSFHHGPACTQTAGCDTPDQNHFGRL